MSDLARYLKARYTDAGFNNLLDLAKRTGIDYQTLQRRIKSPGNFKVYEIQAICDALGISVSDLIQYLIGGAA